MTTLGSQAVQDVTTAAFKVIAAFHNDPLLNRLHPVQRKAIEELERTCRFLYDLSTKDPT